MIKQKTIGGRLVAGKVELSEPLEAPDGTPVRVIYLADSPTPPPRGLKVYRGMFRKEGRQHTTEDDWQEIKKVWEPRDL